MNGGAVSGASALFTDCEFLQLFCEKKTIFSFPFATGIDKISNNLTIFHCHFKPEQRQFRLLIITIQGILIQLCRSL